MDNVLLVAYLLIVIAMIAVILLQRSEGGGLGIGGGNNSFMTARGSANVLTRTTGILAALFFLLAIGLTVIKSVEPGSTAILDSATQTNETDAAQPAPDNVLDALNQLQEQTSGESPASSGGSNATTAPAADTPALAVPETPASSDTSGN